MRVIAGKAKGKKLKPVPGDSTRPTTDRVKESLFGSLMPVIEDSIILDLFAGTGAIGIEALSRGAEKAIFIDLDKKAYQTIKANLDATGLIDLAEVRHTDAFSYLKNCRKSFNLIYIDPPQFQGTWLEALKTIAERPNLLANDAIIIVKMHPKEHEAFESSVLKETRQKKIGNSLLVFYEAILN